MAGEGLMFRMNWMPETTIAAAWLIFLATYAVVALGKIPVYRIDRAGAALLGGSLMVATGAPAARRRLSPRPRRKRNSLRLFRLVMLSHALPIHLNFPVAPGMFQIFACPAIALLNGRRARGADINPAFLGKTLRRGRCEDKL